MSKSQTGSLYTQWAPDPNIPLFTRWSLLQIALALGAVVVVILKLAFGLGAVTHLSDQWPWGIWVGFDVMAGVALAAGGFVTAGVVYIFRLKQFWPVIRPAVFTAFIGYLAASTGIAIDIGRTPRIVHPIWMWQPHSVMFEVALCMTTYTLVLLLEFSPLLLERFRLKFLLKLAHSVMIPLVILGMTLSFLHQSSLGAVFTVMPGLLDPLWYSQLMGYLFFISAVALGLSMVIFESTISSKVFKKGLRVDLLGKLGFASGIVLAIYLGVRFYDMIVNGRLSSLSLSSPLGWLFLIEIIIGMLAPMVMYFIPAVRRSSRGLFIAASLLVFGVVLNRLDTSLIGLSVSRTTAYIPAATEVLFSVGLVAGALFAFRVVAKYLPLFEGRGYFSPETGPRKLAPSPSTSPAYDV